MHQLELRKQVCQANQALASSGLVRWTSGNASGRDPATGEIVIKPSGVLFDDLTPEKMVVLDASGHVIDGDLKPSVDSTSHLYVYQNMPQVHGVVHTHSQYATGFAVAGRDLPISTTTHACLFGARIPCSGLASIGETEIGREIVRLIGDGSAVLLRNHGVFTVGKSAWDALKYAVYAEESAEASFLAHQLTGEIPELDSTFVAGCRSMYLNDYGQEKENNSNY
ncbi:L-ribulose-5-phosphate 4-epimerase [Pseudohoeflea coraliihabitans]|uniref:L-ribulose-5-phosphate 4-epimerase n=1 Tax=Pseudohoeflea coraliihabitans TaxID=2860393 RepID=A0ABS6WJ81_9HYPH|nr:L-ribulose-5-phosphate 4-epimerase [Pseudohoeflea sp. DP4N28-3]MBW3095996.1 class II aldolase/adducin family protein [Pseudohoeflea sp. DP4N28-3]